MAKIVGIKFKRTAKVYYFDPIGLKPKKGDTMIVETARGVEYDTKNPLLKLRLMLPLCVPLLVSSVGKTDATALAAEQRGFYLRTRESSYKRYPMRGVDLAVLLASVALIVAGVAL